MAQKSQPTRSADAGPVTSPVRGRGNGNGIEKGAWSRGVSRAAWLVLAGLAVGAVHSMAVPVRMEVDPSELKGTQIPAVPGADLVGAQSERPAAKVLGLEISHEDARALFDMGVVFLDARHDHEHREGHVVQALRVAPDEFQEKLPQIMNVASIDRPVVIYCDGGQCDASHNLAKLLQPVGFKQIHIMVDGYPAWAKAYPDLTAKGDS